MYTMMSTKLTAIPRSILCRSQFRLQTRWLQTFDRVCARTLTNRGWTRQTRSISTTNTKNVPVHVPEGPKYSKYSNLAVKPCFSLRARTIPEYAGSAHSKLHNVVWRSPLQNIYVVKKPWNDTATRAMAEFIEFIHAEYPSLNVIVSEDVAEELRTGNHVKGAKTAVYTGKVAEIIEKTDLIVSLGGDGTTLRAVSAFSSGSVPPVLCFAMGTLGFLLPFDFSTFKPSFRAVFESRAKAIHRTRLECHVVRQDEDIVSSPSRQREKREIVEYELAHYKQHHATMLYAMNDISLHRGSQPGLIKLDIYIDSEYLTTTNADGLIFATPTGSTAYSLSSGGPIAHPLVPCILLTPVCPQSLSFRPLVLPATSHIMIQLSSGNRNESIKMTIDGIPQPDLRPGDEIHVVNENGTIYIPGKHQPPKTLRSRQSFDDYIEPGYSSGTEQPNGIFCIAKDENDWTVGINELLGFNSSFKGQKRG
ncbi:hypothetical protein OXX59_008216 [Metschnikowia pulcherrima]